MVGRRSISRTWQVGLPETRNARASETGLHEVIMFRYFRENGGPWPSAARWGRRLADGVTNGRGECLGGG